MTPLILATKKKSEQLLNVLIHEGADVDAHAKDVCNLVPVSTSTLISPNTYVNTHRKMR